MRNLSFHSSPTPPPTHRNPNKMRACTQRMGSWSQNRTEKATQAASTKCNVSCVCAQLHIGRFACADVHSIEVSSWTWNFLWLQLRLRCVDERAQSKVIAYNSVYLFFYSIRSLLPLVLAQLLIQFQKPIVVEHALAVNGSRPLINDTLSTSPLSNDSIVHRSTRALGGQLSFDESDNSIRSANLFAPDYSIGMCLRVWHVHLS